jgi:hypothetical protein
MGGKVYPRAAAGRRGEPARRGLAPGLLRAPSAAARFAP